MHMHMCMCMYVHVIIRLHYMWLQVRQLLSIVLSILFFAHPLNAMEVVGIGIVFATLAAQIFSKYLANKQSRGMQPVPMLPLAPDSDQRDTESPTDTENGLASPTDLVDRSDSKPLLRD